MVSEAVNDNDVLLSSITGKFRLQPSRRLALMELTIRTLLLRIRPRERRGGKPDQPFDLRNGQPS